MVCFACSRSFRPKSYSTKSASRGCAVAAVRAFPTATKWSLCRQHAVPAGVGYVVANADEGDPGSYIDRVLLEEDPYNMLEGMLLTGYAVGCTRGVVYVRSEYPRAFEAVAAAVESLREAGLVGTRIRGSVFSFDIDVVSGAGSYVCGEETALLRSLEGQRGMVTARPPFPAERGLFGKPTVVSNVETLASLGFIARRGGAHYATFGTERSRGTKVFCTNSLFVRPGLYELPLGSRLDYLLDELSLGLREGRRIKLVQIGGPLGGILTPRDFDTKLTFEDLEAKGALLGHGGVVAWDESVDARDILLRLLSFAEDESCGKCFPCRIGTVRGREIAERLYERRPASEVSEDLALLEELCDIMKGGSLCAHGGGIPLPVRALVREFPHELRAGAQ
jgi:NADH:ubiquinone oxidoreductase subunit F (NADH-binding)